MSYFQTFSWQYTFTLIALSNYFANVINFLSRNHLTFQRYKRIRCCKKHKQRIENEKWPSNGVISVGKPWQLSSASHAKRGKRSLRVRHWEQRQNFAVVLIPSGCKASLFLSFGSRTPCVNTFRWTELNWLKYVHQLGLVVKRLQREVTKATCYLCQNTNTVRSHSRN